MLLSSHTYWVRYRTVSRRNASFSHPKLHDACAISSAKGTCRGLSKWISLSRTDRSRKHPLGCRSRALSHAHHSSILQRTFFWFNMFIPYNNIWRLHATVNGNYWIHRALHPCVHAIETQRVMHTFVHIRIGASTKAFRSVPRRWEISLWWQHIQHPRALERPRRRCYLPNKSTNGDAICQMNQQTAMLFAKWIVSAVPRYQRLTLVWW